MKIENIKCDFRKCKNLANKVAKMSSLPNDMLGKIIPSYTVWIKICDKHYLGIEYERLDFVVENPYHGVDWAPYSYKCMRCNNVWDSNYLYIKHEEFGKLPTTCSKCNSEYWYKVPRMIREIAAAPRRGKWKETEVYHRVKEAKQ
mgnify:FL=1